MAMASNPELVTIAQAARASGVPVRTLHHWVARGQLPAIAGKRGKLVELPRVLELATDGNGRPQIASDGNGFASDHSNGQQWQGVAGNGAQRDALIARLYAENVEMAGRLGFYQAWIQELEGRLLLAAGVPAEATPAPPQAAQRRPWWRFWSPARESV
jgi:hypothetical protein